MDADQLDIEAFIEEVKNQPTIWDSNSDNYSNRGHKKKAWEYLCTKFIENYKTKSKAEKLQAASHLQRKWKSLKDCYFRELKKQQTSKSETGSTSNRIYVHFEPLQFLSTVNNTRTKDPSVSSKKRKFSELDEDETTKETTENDSDKCFLLSLVDDFKRIPRHRRTDAKYEIIGLIRKFIYMDQNNCDSQVHGYCTSATTSQPNAAISEDSTSQDFFSDPIKTELD